MEFETRAIHEGQQPDPQTGAIVTPIYLSSTYKQEGIGRHKGYEYSRTKNPTRTALEKALASIEDAKFGLAFSSGIAAIHAVFNLLRDGDHIIAAQYLYGGTYILLEEVVKKWSVGTTYVDTDNLTDFESFIQPNTKLIFIETPTNPGLKIVDIKLLANIARKNNLILVVDNTFATPYFQRPLNLGADIVVHSTSKYLGGNSNVIGGAIVTSSQELYLKLKFYQIHIGSIPNPLDCSSVLLGIKTLALRMEKHQKNALLVAQFLENHPKVDRVYYPGLLSHQQHELARKQMTGFGGIISFELQGGLPEVERFFSQTKLFLRAASFGGIESLVSYPAKMSHSSLLETERLKYGIKDNLIRLSVGIEHPRDLQIDLENALL